MQVPFLDINAQNNSIRQELQLAVDSVTQTGQFVLGPAVETFERDFSSYCGTKYCVGLNNGTSALQMALHACDIGPGDEVITTPHTWISTSWAISYVGARPVYVDIDPTTYTLCSDAVEAAITAKTKAILPVHLYGQMCDMEALQKIADLNNLVLIEDAAQSHGAILNERRAGSMGRVGCFSFYPGKNLGAFGEGGAIVTDDEVLANRVRRLRDHAQDGRHNHVELGYNTRMEGLQGAVLSVKLRHLDHWNRLRRQHADRYRELLSGIPQLQLPTSPRPESHVWHLYVIVVRGSDRDELRDQLKAGGVATGIHYPTPVPYQPVYAQLGYKRGQFPVAEDVMSHCCSLPIFPEMTEEQVSHVAHSLESILAAGVRK